MFLRAPWAAHSSTTIAPGSALSWPVRGGFYTELPLGGYINTTVCALSLGGVAGLGGKGLLVHVFPCLNKSGRIAFIAVADITDAITVIANDLFLVKFGLREDRERILNLAYWSFDQCLFSMVPFVKGYDMSCYCFRFIPFWVRIFNILLEKMERQVAIDVGNAIGE
ncbi:hypothetical protein Golax_023444, partial [Gossypium laxum]|nr:hypothetical protein [Gossypium laxum]